MAFFLQNVALAQMYGASTGVGLNVRTAGNPLALMPAVRDAMRLLAAVACLASDIPARSASRIEPIAALRTE